MKIRQDAWSHEDDVYLAETVLTHIREGSTQLRAFDEVGDELNRTSAACGFRWNAVVRSRYVQQIEEAKRERKERKRSNFYAYSPPKRKGWKDEGAGNEITLNAVIHYLQSIEQASFESSSLQNKIHSLQKENEALQEENEKLEKELKKIKRDSTIIEEDYQSLIQIMNRARKMAILEDDDSLASSAFRMDKNGNLEKLAK